ncbi:MAG: BamA/TamA family outer membrane protein [Mangrovibacterium sp.]
MLAGLEKNYIQLTLVLLVLSLVVSCSSTKFVPEGKKLLNDVDIHVDNKQVNKEEIKAQVRQKENLKILGFLKFHLAMYNLSSKKKQNDWLKRIGEEPVIYQEYQTQQSKDQLNLYLQNKGYYDAVIEDTVIQHPKKPKVNLVFNIRTGSPYRIRNYTIKTEDEKIRPLLMNDTIRRLVRKNDIFDVDVLNAERERVVTIMQNRGYYGFSTDYIQFLVDSSLNSRQVDLTMQVFDADPGKKTGPVKHHKQFIVRKYIINSDFNPPRLSGYRVPEPPDTLVIPPYTIIYQGKLKYRPRLLDDLNRIQDGRFYSLRNVEKTYRSLNQIRQFRMVNLNFDIVDSLGNDSIGVLDSRFQLSPLPRQGFSVDLEGTNSSGNLGVAGNLNYQHRNLFLGAEILNITLKGAFERQQAVMNESDLNFNTHEYGVEGSLTLPKFLSPVQGKNFFNFQVPQTSFTLGYNYQRRPDYTRTITNFRFGYNWKSKPFRTHYLNLIDFNYVNLYEFNEDFINSIKDLYIKSSYTDHLISALSYTRVDNTQIIGRRENYHYFKWSFESAGNLLFGLAELIDREKRTEIDTITNEPVSYYQIFSTRFAQYIKTDFEYRYGYMLDKYNSVVGRLFMGVGLPYGNFDQLPFEKKYFSGGANGIRAWQVRTLGPGTYKAPPDAYPNQSADIKLESNLEYRFRLLGRVEGAFFLDAGNIWAINKNDNREGALFKFDRFYKEIAVGTGTGLRFNFNYFIFRLDLGMKLRDPSLESGKRLIIGNYPVNADHFNLSFAIGYPF